MTTAPDPIARAAQFPPDFVWGVATAAQQIEGAALEGGRRPSIWDVFAETAGNIVHGDTGDIACDHYHRWEQDLDLMAELGIRAYRLSLSWARLQPTGHGELNPEGVEFYRGVLAGARARGIEPYVTLYHWDLPQQLEDEGGWPVRATAEAFADYVALVIGELGDLAAHWITLNEPWCSSVLGYGTGAHAPGRTSNTDMVAAGHHLVLAHGLALARIRAARPELKVGVTNVVVDLVPRSASDADAAALDRADAMYNRFFLDPVYTGAYSPGVYELFEPFGLADLVRDGDLRLASAPVDFVGINHYQRVEVWADDDSGDYLRIGQKPVEPATTGLGWSVVPESLPSVLRRVHRDYSTLPLLVTEHGAAYHDYVDPNGAVLDLERVAYFDRYLEALGDAVDDGVPVAAYFAWSFMDNWEWAEGYRPRFGLVFVDYGTQRRIPKSSARYYAALLEGHRQGASGRGKPPQALEQLGLIGRQVDPDPALPR